MSTTGADAARRLLRTMVLIRRFEERCIELYSAAKIRGFLHVCIGEEAIPAGVLDVLEPDDAVVATYREHGHAIARGLAPGAVMAELYGVSEGSSRGRGGSMHIFDKAARFYGGNAIVGAGLPVAVGLALADRLQDRRHVTACFFGEGAVAEGEFHESVNLAALWRLPVLFCCENNLYAMGTALERSESQTSIALKAASYGMTAWQVDGMDVVAVEDAARRAVESIRGGGGPVLLEFRTYRFRGHSMYDPELYRDRAEVESHRGDDPITRLVARLTADGDLTPADLQSIEDDVARVVDDAVAFAENGTLEPIEMLTRFVTSEAPR